MNTTSENNIRRRQVLAVLSLLTAQPIYMFYVGARSVVLSQILTELNGMQFFSITVILSSTIMAITLPIAGSISDKIGRRTTYLLGLGGYCIAMVLCAMALNTPMLLLGISMCGFTNGFTSSVTYALVSDTFAEAQRPKIISYISILTAASSLLGPVLGGALTDFKSWRLVFVLLLVLEALNFCCAAFGIPRIKPISTARNLDYLGIVFFTLCIAPFLYLLTSAGGTFSWLSLQTALLTAVSLVSLAALVRREKKHSAPLIPTDVIKTHPEYLICLIVTITGGICYSGMNYLALYYQNVRGMNATMSGMMTVPRQGGMMLASLLIGVYISRKRKYRRSLLIGIGVFSLAVFLIAQFGTDTLIPILLFSELLYGAADGISAVGPSSIAQHYLSKDEVGRGMAFSSFAGTFGNSLGAALNSAILQGAQNFGGSFCDGLNSAFWVYTAICASVFAVIIRFWPAHRGA